MAYTTINKSTEHFNTKLYSGNATARSITGVGFQPDFTWIKNRSYTHNNVLSDAVRGSNKGLNSDTTNTEVTDSSNGYVTGFVSDGFSISNSDYGWVNNSSSNYVSWNWKANGSGSSNSDGSITSTVSANTTAGFSICAWNGNSGTVGHGLGVKPALIIVKSRQTANNWVVLHKDLTGGMDTNALILNATDAEQGGGSGMAEPTSSVFTITAGLAANDNNIGYVFAEKTGDSKFGSYTGNGNADGTFIYTGFKPSLIFQKRVDSTSNWHFFDTAREPINPMNKYLLANNSGAEGTSGEWDFLSNGFKIRSGSHWQNQSGGTYIYMAIGQSLVGSNNVPCTAR